MVVEEKFWKRCDGEELGMRRGFRKAAEGDVKG